MSGTSIYMTVLRLLPTGLCLHYVPHWFQWSCTRRRFGLCRVLITAIRLFENTPGLILIYRCHLYHLKSAEQNEAKIACGVAWPNSRAFMHAKCTSTPTWLPEPLVFKGNAQLLAVQLKPDGHPSPMGKHVLGVERLALMVTKQKWHCCGYRVNHRITGWLRTEGASGNHRIQLHAQIRIN